MHVEAAHVEVGAEKREQLAIGAGRVAIGVAEMKQGFGHRTILLAERADS
jgi:hypothetical protein